MRMLSWMILWKLWPQHCDETFQNGSDNTMDEESVRTSKPAKQTKSLFISETVLICQSLWFTRFRHATMRKYKLQNCSCTNLKIQRCWVFVMVLSVVFYQSDAIGYISSLTWSFTVFKSFVSCPADLFRFLVRIFDGFLSQLVKGFFICTKYVIAGTCLCTDLIAFNPNTLHYVKMWVFFTAGHEHCHDHFVKLQMALMLQVTLADGMKIFYTGKITSIIFMLHIYIAPSWYSILYNGDRRCHQTLVMIRQLTFLDTEYVGHKSLIDL